MRRTSPIKLVVSGCCGRMGSLILEEASQSKQFEIAGALEHEGHPQLGQALSSIPKLKVSADLRGTLSRADLLIEFTNPEASISHARAAAEAKVPMILGTTGFTPEQFEQLKGFSKKIPLFWSPNMSVGIVIVRRAITSISQLLFKFGLGEQTQVGISETHHVKKLDKPSGTAKALAQELFKATGWLIRDEQIEARREGEVIGIHSLTFSCPSEKISLTHEATDRRIFAQGALLVAQNFRWVCAKPGWYTMDHFVKALEKSSGSAGQRS